MKMLIPVAGALCAGLVLAAPASADNQLGARLLLNFVFQNGDANDDGRLDPGEIAAMRLQAFERADADGNGSISRAEQQAAAARRARRADLARMMGDEGFDRFDVNGDGSVSLAEYEAGPRPGFALVDIDGDGAIDRAEMDRVLAIIAEAR